MADLTLSDKTVASFQRKIRQYFKQHKRRLPFRETSDPYAITVSELMLQQTQVDRVVLKYVTWLNDFPDWAALAKASTRDIYKAWSGLGYNRRARYLHETAKIVVTDYNGLLPDSVDELVRLPGIGPYTARAIAVFAFGQRQAAVDTNIRKVLIHMFDLPVDISLVKVQKIAESVLPKSNIRDWHYALMDYANDPIIKPLLRSIKPLSRQSKFEGSLRQIRGEIIRQLTSKPKVSIFTIQKQLARSEADVIKAATSLKMEGVIIIQGKWLLLK